MFGISGGLFVNPLPQTSHTREGLTIPNNTQREQHEQELAEAARGGERRAEQPADAAARVARLPLGVVDGCGGRAEAFDEDAGLRVRGGLATNSVRG